RASLAAGRERRQGRRGRAAGRGARLPALAELGENRQSGRGLLRNDPEAAAALTIFFGISVRRGAILRVVRAVIGSVAAAILMLAVPQAQTPAERHRATLDQYCVTCH